MVLQAVRILLTLREWFVHASSQSVLKAILDVVSLPTMYAFPSCFLIKRIIKICLAVRITIKKSSVIIRMIMGCCSILVYIDVSQSIWTLHPFRLCCTKQLLSENVQFYTLLSMITMQCIVCIALTRRK